MLIIVGASMLDWLIDIWFDEFGMYLLFEVLMLSLRIFIIAFWFAVSRFSADLGVSLTMFQNVIKYVIKF